MGKLKQLDAKNYQFSKYDEDPIAQKKRKKQKKKEDQLFATAISQTLSQGQTWL